MLRGSDPTFVQNRLHFGDPCELRLQILPKLACRIADEFHLGSQSFMVSLQAIELGACRGPLFHSPTLPPEA